MKNASDKLNEFERGYIAAMLWSSTDSDDNPLDDNFTDEDLAEETASRVAYDCGYFFAKNLADLQAAAGLYQDSVPRFNGWRTAGVDFWLTRNGHGAGFWDGDLPEDLGERLTASAELMGAVDPYLADNGLIYFM